MFTNILGQYRHLVLLNLYKKHYDVQGIDVSMNSGNIVSNGWIYNFSGIK